MQLYSSLIHELKPNTIIEFGSLQGGSALWFADQMRLNDLRGHIHSFDLFVDVIHEKLKNDNKIIFHHINLNNLNELNEDFLLSLPRPWLVIDDAHVNMKNLIPKVSKLLQPGDYYILEDIFYIHIGHKLIR